MFNIGGAHLESLGLVKKIALDKTGKSIFEFTATMLHSPITKMTVCNFFL